MCAHASAVLVREIEFETSVMDRLAAVGPEIGYALAAVMVGLLPVFVRHILLRE